MAKAKRKPRPQIQIAEPTPEQYGKGAFARQTMAYRRIPVIDTMAATGKLSKRQHAGLSRYRDIAAAAERSPIRDSLDKALQGRGGNGDCAILMRFGLKTELARLQRALGGLQAITHAIAFDDETVSQWAIRHWGGRDRTVGNVTYIVPRYKSAQADAMLHIQQAGDALAQAIGA
jgi:hypothetical protein